MPRSLHVQCTFNVRSLSAHCERVVPVVKSMRSVKEGVGSVTGCILNYAFAALSLQLLQREHFAQGTSRKSISFCFRPAGHIHIQHTHSLHATMLHAPAQRDKCAGNRPGQSGVWRYVVCLESMDRLGLTGLHRCMVSCKGKFLVEADIEHTVNIQWTATLNTHWTQSKKLQIAANLCSWLWFSRKKHKHWIFFRFPPIRSFPQFSQCSMPRSLHVQCTFTVSSLRARGTCRKKYEVCEGRRGSVTCCILNSRLCSFVFATFAERALCSGYVS